MGALCMIENIASRFALLWMIKHSLVTVIVPVTASSSQLSLTSTFLDSHIAAGSQVEA